MSIVINLGRQIYNTKRRLSRGKCTFFEKKIQSSKFKVHSVEIFDVFGRKVGGKFPSVIPNAVRNPEQYGPKPDGVVIDLTVLHPGVYFVKITTEAGQVVKKVVKQ